MDNIQIGATRDDGRKLGEKRLSLVQKIMVAGAAASLATYGATTYMINHGESSSNSVAVVQPDERTPYSDLNTYVDNSLNTFGLSTSQNSIIQFDEKAYAEKARKIIGLSMGIGIGTLALGASYLITGSAKTFVIGTTGFITAAAAPSLYKTFGIVPTVAVTGLIAKGMWDYVKYNK